MRRCLNGHVDTDAHAHVADVGDVGAHIDSNTDAHVVDVSDANVDVADVDADDTACRFQLANTPHLLVCTKRVYKGYTATQNGKVIPFWYYFQKQ